ncbi:MAG: YceD family protein [Sphingomonadaceae bacterium]|nr:DUF177 domain-containing protein [Sphingomonadaceae bacterium]
MSASTVPEFSRMVAARHLPAEPMTLEASEAERAALADRFGLSRIDSLTAVITLAPDGEAVLASGPLKASFQQACAISGNDFPNRIDEVLQLRFVPPAPPAGPDEEIELEAGELDEVEYEGEQFDLGEAIAQGFGLAIDPYATGPDADRVRQEAGLSDEAASGPFAALAALKKDN